MLGAALTVFASMPEAPCPRYHWPGSYSLDHREEAETARAAFSRYGKGPGHPAQLNLGDCFAYAVAKNHRTALLFKDEDFDKTDIPIATRS
jgi:uncharacterized protein with PIN domain